MGYHSSKLENFLRASELVSVQLTIEVNENKFQFMNSHYFSSPTVGQLYMKGIGAEKWETEPLLILLATWVFSCAFLQPKGAGQVEGGYQYRPNLI